MDWATVRDRRFPAGIVSCLQPRLGIIPVSGFDPNKKAAGVTLSNGNYSAVQNGASRAMVLSVTGHATGKYYAEMTFNVNASGNVDVSGAGIANSSVNLTLDIGATADSWGFLLNSGTVKNNGSTLFTGGALVANDTAAIVMIAYDGNAGNLWVGLNNTWFNSGDPGAGTGQVASGITGTMYVAAGMPRANPPSPAFDLRTGQTAFTYSLPSGFLAWG